WLVGLTITATYWFTSSTSFANPAVTLARGLTTTFAGIALSHVPGFMAAQLVGAAGGAMAALALFSAPRAGCPAPGRVLRTTVTAALPDACFAFNAIATLGVAADVRQHARVVLLHHPARQRQPVEDRIEAQFVRGALDDVGAAVRAGDKLEARLAGVEIADHVRRVYVRVRAELAHRRDVGLHHEGELAPRLPCGDALDRGPGRELAAAHGADAVADHLAAQRVGDAKPERQRERPLDGIGRQQRPPHRLGRRGDRDGLVTVEARDRRQEMLAHEDQRQPGEARQRLAGGPSRQQRNPTPQEAADHGKAEADRRRHHQADDPFHGERDE